MILRGKGGRNVELYSFSLTDMTRWGYQGLRNVGGGFGDREMRGIPAIHRAARLRAEAVAALRLGVFRGDGADRVPVLSTWQARLFRGRPNPVQTRFGLWEAIEESLAFRGNAYLWKNVYDGRVVEWWALHPDQVAALDDGRWKVTVTTGYVDPVGQGPGAYTVDDSTVLHIRGHGQGGQRLAPSPIEVFRDAMAGPVGRQKHEARTWRRGSSVQVAVEFPANVNKDQAERWRDLWKASYEGMDGETVAVIGGGGQIKPIGMTLADASFVDLAHLTVEDASRIMAVPANLLGTSIQQRGTPNLEQELMTWLRFGLGPELDRIEDALFADDELFGTQALLKSNAAGSLGLYPAFLTEDFVRGDLQTEDNITHQRIQDGRLLVDEWRVANGYKPLPNGLGQVPQITPVGGAPNPNHKPTADPVDDPDDAPAGGTK